MSVYATQDTLEMVWIAQVVFGRNWLIHCNRLQFALVADLNECEHEDICHPHAECINTNGSFYCNCNPGFEGDGYHCSSKSTDQQSRRRCGEQWWITGSLLSKILGPQGSNNPTNNSGGSQETVNMASVLAGVFGTVGGIIITIVAIVVVVVLVKLRKRKKEQNGDQHRETRYIQIPIFLLVSQLLSEYYTIPSS